MATLFSIPAYIPDNTSIESVVGYDVQACAATGGLPLFSGSWSTVSGSPFSSNSNIVDTTGMQGTQYRARPIRQVLGPDGVTTYTLDTPYSNPFTADTPVYDTQITRSLLPALRFTYLNDMGVAQSCGTVISENVGAGNGLWLPDGTTKRFQLQVIDNDDPIHVLDNVYRMIHTTSTGSAISSVPDVDYTIDVKTAVVEFKIAPAIGDYIRFDFYKCVFVNSDLLKALSSAINALSQFGINGFATHQENNLMFMRLRLDTDLIEITCKLAIHLMRLGLTESALQATTSWRDGGEASDPVADRSLQFVVLQGQITEKSVQLRANAYIRSHTRPIVRGDIDMMTDLTQNTPLSRTLLSQFVNMGYLGGYAGTSYLWWL